MDTLDQGEPPASPMLRYPQPRINVTIRESDPSLPTSFYLSMVSPLHQPRIRLLKAYMDDYPEFKTLFTWTYFFSHNADQNMVGTLPLAVNALTFFLWFCKIPYYRRKPNEDQVKRGDSTPNAIVHAIPDVGSGTNVQVGNSTETSENVRDSIDSEGVAEVDTHTTDDVVIPDIVHVHAQYGDQARQVHTVDIRVHRHPVAGVVVKQEFFNMGPLSYRLFYEYVE